MPSKYRTHAPCIAFCATAMMFTLSQPLHAQATQLSASDVRATFVGREWTQGNGTFFFATDGSYSYTSQSRSVSGTWRMDKNGTICTTNAQASKSPGRRTCYTFFKNGKRFSYFHDRSNKFWPARLK